VTIEAGVDQNTRENELIVLNDAGCKQLHWEQMIAAYLSKWLFVGAKVSQQSDPKFKRVRQASLTSRTPSHCLRSFAKSATPHEPRAPLQVNSVLAQLLNFSLLILIPLRYGEPGSAGRLR